jgi:hypothetical protein
LVEKISPVRYSEIAKLFVILMAVQLTLFMLMPIPLLAVVQYFLLASILVSGALAYYLYLRTRHIELSYDTEGFDMRRGRLVLSHRWSEFSRVLLIKVRGTEFFIRLFFTNGETLDIPASKLRTNVFSFRLKILELVQESTRSRKAAQL